MDIPPKYVAMIMLLALINYGQAQNSKIDIFIETLRQKVRHLEETGRIKRDHPNYTEPPLRDGETYDFIIVGAGSSGSALINRLSEISKWKILLLEAGGEPDVLTDIPFWSTITHYTDLNWRFYAEKEPHLALGLDNQRIYLPRGKGLGGSSLINFMMFVRGIREDYDKWAGLGNPGWSYEDVLPIFKRLENCTVRYQDEGYRGHSGPVTAADTYVTKSGKIFREAGERSGYRYVDFNGRTNEGVSYLQGNLKNGLRCSGELCYIRPVKNRPNLTIRLRSHVTKVLIKNKIAYGVEFVKDGVLYRAYANKEVILSAGVFNSPHILLLSGIGPKKQLEKFGIKVIKDLPVGQKMLDHNMYLGLGFTVNDSIAFDTGAALKDEAFIKLFSQGKGILTSLGSAENILFTKTPFSITNTTDVEIIFASSSYATSKELGIAGLIGLSQEVYNYTYQPYEANFTVSCGIVLLHPRSHGRLELRSDDPFVHPKIYMGYFTDPNGRDIKTLIAGIREAIRVTSSPPFTKYGIKLMSKPVYGCQQHVTNSDQYWECVLRHTASTIFHQTTTCKMGPARDKEAVVDSRLRVHGIHDLRVVDTSVIPVSLSGHTNIPAYMMGEKAFDIIKQDYWLMCIGYYAGRVFIEPAENAGYQCLDYNGREHKGVSYCQATTKKGFRCSGERCYIRPIKNRKYLTIRLDSHVTKVLIKDRAAYGVRFTKNGKHYRAYAKKQVVLCAGVINSAHILLLSGIGPERQLAKFDIPLVQDLPVGQKIYDHPVYWGLGFTLNETLRYSVEDALKDEAFEELYNEGKGVLHDLTRAESNKQTNKMAMDVPRA